MRQLQVQVQALRAAITEAAELDRQRAAAADAGAEEPRQRPRVEARARRPRSERADRRVPRRRAPAARARGADASPRRAAARRAARRREPTPWARIRGKIDVPAGEPVAYVYVENILAPAVKGEHKVIQQAGKKFVPGWAVIQRGTAIAFPNNDNIYHNVFSLSAGNSFDLGLYNSGGEAKSHTFTEAGPVDVYCNIHPQMAASVLVVPNRHYAKVKPTAASRSRACPRGDARSSPGRPVRSRDPVRARGRTPAPPPREHAELESKLEAQEQGRAGLRAENGATPLPAGSDDICCLCEGYVCLCVH